MANSRQLTSGAPKLDAEFQAVYDAEVLPKQPESVSVKSDSASPAAIFDEFEALAKLAKDRQASSISRKELAPGSFDQIEHDVSTAFRLGWDLLTR